VLSGDTIIVRGPPRGGPPPERTIGLSNIIAPRLARRPGGAADAESRDEVCFWTAVLLVQLHALMVLQCKPLCVGVTHEDGQMNQFGSVDVTY
jgi:hypothetical protein